MAITKNISFLTFGNPSAIGLWMLSIGLLLTAPLISTAQDNNPLAGKDTLVLENERIEDVIDSDKPALKPPAKKVGKPDPKAIEYRSKNYFIETDYEPATPQLQPYLLPAEESPYKGMVKLGIGRFITPLLQASYGDQVEETLAYDLFFEHHSAHQDQVEYRRFRRNQAKAGIRYLTDKNLITGKVHFFNTSYFNYADTLSRESVAALEDTIRMSFSRIHVEGAFASHPDATDDLAYELGAAIRYFNGRRGNSEFHLDLKPKASYALSEQVKVGLRTELTLSDTQIDTADQDRIFLGLNPYFSYQSDSWQVEAGILFNYYRNKVVDDEAVTQVSPMATVRYHIFPESLQLFAGVKGGVQYNQYYDMIFTNPYLSSQVLILPTEEKLQLFAGVEGNITHDFDFSAKIFYQQLDNFLVYGVEEGGAYFQAAYDSSTTVFGLYGEVNMDLDNGLRAGAALTLRNFSTDNLPEALHHTPLRLDLYAEYMFNKQLTVRAKSQIYGSTPVFVRTSGEILNRNTFMRLDFSADYRIIDRFSVFLSVSNLFGTQYQRWLNYPERPIDFNGGITFIF